MNQNIMFNQLFRMQKLIWYLFNGEYLSFIVLITFAFVENSPGDDSTEEQVETTKGKRFLDMDQEIDDAADSTDQKMVSNEVFRTGHCTQ